MNRDQIREQVVDTLSELFELPKDRIRGDSDFTEDLDLDSIDAIDLAVKIQEQTGTSLEQEQLRALRKVDDVVLLLERLLAERPDSGSAG